METCREDSFFSVLNGKHLKTVYQPIVSLQNGSVFGYEALSRIHLPECPLNIEQLFAIARRVGKLWELEKLCRTAALENAMKKPRTAKLFMNVDSNVIYDPELREGFTREKLEEYGFDPDDLVFEITERSAIGEMDVFVPSIEHYRQQNFKIAIDDFGAGYSGLSRVCALSPNYIKIDREIVRDIRNQPNKKSLVGSIVKFCKEMNIVLIAEGIETEEELDTLIRLGVDYGQGYYLGMPAEEFLEPSPDLKLAIKVKKGRAFAVAQKRFLFGTIDAISQKQPTVAADSPAVEVFRKMQQDEKMQESFVLNADKTICGILTRSNLFERFGGMFGYNLSLKRSAGQLMSPGFLSVERSATIDEVARRAMDREVSQVYDSVAVTDGGEYFGVVTVRDLLMAAISIQVQRASEASPLTGLPGNAAIQNTISSVLSENRPFSIIYLDLDNFKAYNDAYGFASGDKMIKAVADTIRSCCREEDFMGHIGGDDFVIVSSNYSPSAVRALCNGMIHTFSEAVRSLYSEEDRLRGYIISQNRNGFTENFRLATLSIAVVTNYERSFSNMEDISKSIAEVKKKSKQVPGNSVVIL
jgi:diguanylate cyclase (GGDEF)-like protein